MDFCIYLGKRFTTYWRETLKMLIRNLAYYIIHVQYCVQSLAYRAEHGNIHSLTSKCKPLLIMSLSTLVIKNICSSNLRIMITKLAADSLTE